MDELINPLNAPCPSVTGRVSVDLNQNLIPRKVVAFLKITHILRGVGMMHKAMQLEEPERMNTLTTLEAVAYANRLSNKLKCDDCTDEERKAGLLLLGKLTERVEFLKISLERPKFCQIGWNHFPQPDEAI